MPYEVSEQPAAADTLDRLAAAPELAAVLDAVERTIDRLAQDPFNRRLGTTAFRSELLGYLNVTPARADDWYIVWRRGEQPRSLVIVAVSRISVGKPSSR